MKALGGLAICWQTFTCTNGFTPELALIPLPSLKVSSCPYELLLEKLLMLWPICTHGFGRYAKIMAPTTNGSAELFNGWINARVSVELAAALRSVYP